MKWAAVWVLVGGVTAVGIAVIAFLAGRAEAPGAVASRLDMRATPGVTTAIRDVARLETTEFHIEKVVEVSDAQSRLWGLVHAKDALLLVAVGDVVAGIDLAGVHDEDVHVDEATHSVAIRLPAPQIVAATLDEHATHVYSRSTDALAVRNEALEGAARQAAEDQMRKAAIDEGILDRARASADRTLRVFLRSLGYDRVEIDWRERS